MHFPRFRFCGSVPQLTHATSECPMVFKLSTCSQSSNDLEVSERQFRSVLRVTGRRRQGFFEHDHNKCVEGTFQWVVVVTF